MGKSRKDYEKYLNSISPDRDDEAWIIGGKNRYCGRENYGTMIKRYDPIGFNVGYREWVRCVLCGAQMLLPCGADKCPECGENGTLRWVDEERQEIDAKGLDCLDYVRELRVDDYLSPTTLEEIAEEIKKKVNRG